MKTNFCDKIINFVFPNKCAMCGQPSPTALCKNCFANIRELELGRCNGCGKSPKSCVCKKHRNYKRCVSAFDYNARGIASVIYKVKANGNKLAVNFLADSIVRQIKREYEFINFNYITYVPIAKSKRFAKGFDHAELLAKQVAKSMNVSYIAPPIMRIGKVNQKTLNLTDRNINASHAFTLKKNRRISGTVLLIDDVMTSGATLYKCSEILKQAGANEVYCATAATA